MEFAVLIWRFGCALSNLPEAVQSPTLTVIQTWLTRYQMARKRNCS